MRSSPPPAGRAAAAVAFFGYLLNVVTTLLTASGPQARHHEAIKTKMQARGQAAAACAAHALRPAPTCMHAAVRWLLAGWLLQDVEEMMRVLKLPPGLKSKIRTHFSARWTPPEGQANAGHLNLADGAVCEQCWSSGGSLI